MLMKGRGTRKPAYANLPALSEAWLQSQKFASHEYKTTSVISFSYPTLIGTSKASLVDSAAYRYVDTQDKKVVKVCTALRPVSDDNINPNLSNNHEFGLSLNIPLAWADPHKTVFKVKLPSRGYT